MSSARHDIPPEMLREVGLEPETNGTLPPLTPLTPLLREIPDASPFPVDALPGSCRRLVAEAAAALECPPDLVALPMLATLGSAIACASTCFTPPRIWTLRSWVSLLVRAMPRPSYESTRSSVQTPIVRQKRKSCKWCKIPSNGSQSRPRGPPFTLAELPAKRYIRGWFAAYLRGFETRSRWRRSKRRTSFAAYLRGFDAAHWCSNWCKTARSSFQRFAFTPILQAI
jgi:hypothetical protein